MIGYNPNLSDKNKQEEAQGGGYPFLLECLDYYNYYYYICLVIMDVWRSSMGFSSPFLWVPVMKL